MEIDISGVSGDYRWTNFEGWVSLHHNAVLEIHPNAMRGIHVNQGLLGHWYVIRLEIHPWISAVEISAELLEPLV